MKIQSTSGPLTDVEAQWLVLCLFDNQTKPPDSIKETPLGDLVGRLLAEKEVPTGVGETTPLIGNQGLSAGSVLLVGLGPRERFDAGVAYATGVAIGRRLGGKPRESVAVALPESDQPQAIASALTEGVIAGTRGPGLRKSEPGRHPFGGLQVIAHPQRLPSSELSRAVRRGEIVGQAINLARDLANLPPAEKAPAQLARIAEENAAAAGISVSIWDEERVRRERFGGVLGVSAGSDAPPAFVVLEYRRGGDTPMLALVGKGVTFDSGGLCLKPPNSMEDMKSDMTGAAVVLATMVAIARLHLPVNLTGYLALTENMTGGKAMKMGDVLTIRNGKTIEVLNTDAEGRLILADALSYAVEQRPARILDLATLTGACVVALGSKVAGLFSNDDVFANDVLAACRATGERAWRMPLDDDYKELLKSNVADLKNIGGKWAGAITAAKFLEQFVADAPWVHLDIAGPSWADTETATRDVGGTGCFVRTLIALVEASLPPS
jgi:leucyl aminopeptidase